jgi:ubiquinone/menaquinone biosynthesis C-methylase UbiE
LPSKDSENIAEWYDVLSQNYDELYGEEQGKKYSKVLERLGNREFRLAIDVGCGNGILLELISARCQLALGIDLSVRMLKEAKLRTKKSTVDWIRADASHLPLRNHLADGVISVSMLVSGPIFMKHFRELSRIATENATLIFTIFLDKNQIAGALFDGNTEPATSLSEREQLYLIDRTAGVKGSSASRL